MEGWWDGIGGHVLYCLIELQCPLVERLSEMVRNAAHMELARNSPGSTRVTRWNHLQLSLTFLNRIYYRHPEAWIEGGNS